MARVHHARPQHARTRTTTLDQSRTALKKQKPYKVVLEAVTQEKKKLRSIVTYGPNAPTGFGFIPAGHPDVTEWCKEQCRQRNLDVHIVSAKPKNKSHTDPEKLSHHVHRVGHHFPLTIIQLACSKFGYTYDEARGLHKVTASDRTNWIVQQVENYSSRNLQGRPPTSDQDTKHHIRSAVREMFSKIPELDLSSIVSHAFEEGTDRVGNATELSLARKVQLAVVAHIRHTYTDYDKLLKSHGWGEARARVEHVSLAKLKEWRDEADEQSNEVEETFREVIVLDDDDDVSSDHDSLSSQQSMEIVSSRATARDLQPERCDDYQRIDVDDRRRIPPRPPVVQPYPPPAPGPSYVRPGLQEPSPLDRSLIPMSESRLSPRYDVFRIAHSRPMDPRTRPAPSQPGPMTAPINGRLYQLEPIDESRGRPRVEYVPPHLAVPRRAPDGYIPLPPRPSSFDRPPAHIRRPSDQDVVLPSVEHETVNRTSPRRVAESQQPFQDPIPHSQAFVQSQSSKRKAFPTLPDSRDVQTEHSNKRSRPMYEDNMYSRPVAYQGGPSQSLSYQSMDARSHPRPQPPQQVIDLTSSPHRPFISGDRGAYLPARSYPADPNGHAYFHVSARLRSPMSEVRRAYYKVPAGEPLRANLPENRMYERRAPLAHDHMPPRDERLHIEDEGARYLRSGVKYGGR